MRPEDLASKSGVGMRTVVRIEAAKTKRMRLDTATSLSKLLEIPIEELRPPALDDDQGVHDLLAEVLSRLQRIELAVGVPATVDGLEAQDEDDESVLPPDPNGSQNEEPEPGAETG